MKFFAPERVRAGGRTWWTTSATHSAVLEDEQARGLPRLLSLGFHLRITGRPGRFAALRDILVLLGAEA